jgi:hypothetical protein
LRAGKKQHPLGIYRFERLVDANLDRDLQAADGLEGALA